MCGRVKALLQNSEVCVSELIYGKMVEMDYGTALLRRRRCKSTTGSNPVLSARIFEKETQHGIQEV